MTRNGLDRRERRELREIEQALTFSDPGLAGMLTWTVDRAIRRARTAVGAVVATSVLLIIGGLILRDSTLMISGCLVLLVIPPTVWLITAFSGG
jgi:hypothetical protein